MGAARDGLGFRNYGLGLGLGVSNGKIVNKAKGNLTSITKKGIW